MFCDFRMSAFLAFPSARFSVYAKLADAHVGVVSHTADDLPSDIRCHVLFRSSIDLDVSLAGSVFVGSSVIATNSHTLEFFVCHHGTMMSLKKARSDTQARPALAEAALPSMSRITSKRPPIAAEVLDEPVHAVMPAHLSPNALLTFDVPPEALPQSLVVPVQKKSMSRI